MIDVLQQWRLRKKTEHALKSAYYLSSSAGVSVVPPGIYKDRFVRQLLAKFTPATDAVPTDVAPSDAVASVLTSGKAAPTDAAPGVPGGPEPSMSMEVPTQMDPPHKCVRYLSNLSQSSVDL